MNKGKKSVGASKRAEVLAAKAAARQGGAITEFYPAIPAQGSQTSRAYYAPYPPDGMRGVEPTTGSFTQMMSEYGGYMPQSGGASHVGIPPPEDTRLHGDEDEDSDFEADEAALRRPLTTGFLSIPAALAQAAETGGFGQGSRRRRHGGGRKSTGGLDSLTRAAFGAHTGDAEQFQLLKTVYMLGQSFVFLL